MNGDDIRKFRERMGWNQGQLAKALEVTSAAVSAWETGVRSPSPSNEILLQRLMEKDELAGDVAKGLAFAGLAALTLYLMGKRP
jgi:DNA-binding transcriptional regulator YiaG